MRIKKNKLPFFGLVILVSGILLYCKSKEEPFSKINFHIHYAYGQKVYVETIPLINGKTKIIDSAIVKNGNDQILFKINRKEERPYRIRVKGSEVNIVFINDAPSMGIEANYLHPQEYRISGSPASMALDTFMKGQAKLMEENRQRSRLIDSLKMTKAPKKIIDSLIGRSDQVLAYFFQGFINFADTISSPGAFLYIYNNVDFGTDYTGLKKFIIHAAGRFPSSQPVQVLEKETLEYLENFEQEYNVGDQLPAVELPDNNGNMFSTSLLKGKYVFMDFWSTWCDRCMAYDDEKIKAKKMFPPGKFDIVSIAYDDQIEAWKSYIAARKLDWHQLIDEKMWNGIAEKTFKIDSIPFNFILDPGGKVLYKAVKKDSLLPILKKIIR